MSVATARKGEYVLPPRVRPSYCRSCGATIVWARTQGGRATPLDLATVEERGGERHALTHFATCPQGRAWSGYGATPSPALAAPAVETSGARYVAGVKARKGAGQVWCWWLKGRIDYRRPAELSHEDMQLDAAAVARSQQLDDPEEVH